MSELTQSLAPAKLRPWHEAIIDMWLVEPQLTQNEICARLGKTPAWVSIIVNGDAFKHAMAERKAEILDPQVRASVEDRLKSVVSLAADKLADRIALGTVGNKELIAAIGVGTKGLGMGASVAPVQQNNLYFLPPPGTPQSAEAWSAKARGEVVDAVERVPAP